MSERVKDVDALEPEKANVSRMPALGARFSVSRVVLGVGGSRVVGDEGAVRSSMAKEGRRTLWELWELF